MSRNTIQQEIIFSTVSSMTNHPSSDEVFKAVHEKYPAIGRATVYRVLNKLANQGKIKKVNLPDTASRFDFRTDNHVHFRCVKCNKVFDADFCQSEEVKQTLERIEKLGSQLNLSGFDVHSTDFSFQGLCKECSDENE